MTRPGDTGPAPKPEAAPPVPAALVPILATLGGEVRRPLGQLKGGIDRLLGDPSRAMTEAERLQARSMLGLCDDLDRLTRESLEAPAPPADA